MPDRNYDRCLNVYKPCIHSINNFAQEVYDVSVVRGKWNKTAINTDGLSGIMEEYIETVHAYCSETEQRYVEERIDLILACLSTLVYNGVDVEAELLRKHQINSERAGKRQ